MYIYIYMHSISILAQYIYIRWTAIPFENLVVLGWTVRTLGKKIGLTEVLKRHSSDLRRFIPCIYIYIYRQKHTYTHKRRFPYKWGYPFIAGWFMENPISKWMPCCTLG